MDKLKMRTPDLADENFKKLSTMFPNAITETINENGEVVRAIDVDILQQEISGTIIAGGGKERYQFTWPDKKKSVVLANQPINKTLRLDREKSVGRDGTPGSIDTENIYIEGDNLDALKLLQETYLGKVKMIYIDPPYNTGNDFIYEDDFSQSAYDYLDNSGQSDEEGNRLVANSESNGRFHTDWLNMIYPRLRLAKDLLSDDGVIFISIDDNEVENLKKVCHEIFGSNNFIASIIWKRKRGRDNSARWFSKAHEYCLLYAKNHDFFDVGYLELDEETKKAYKNPDNDPRGNYRMLGCWARGTQGGVKYDFTSKNGQYFSERLWLFSKENLTKLDSEDKLIIRGDNIYRKMFIHENKGKIPETLWDDVSNAANASDEIKKLFKGIVFDTPKPTPYIQRMIQIATAKDSIILDFFSGSATTANAVMQCNALDGGTRKFILVQIPEDASKNENANKEGLSSICEIGEERIRRSGKILKEEHLELNMDIGFRVFKVDSSNMKDVYYKPADYDQVQIDLFAENIKEDRTPEDLLFQVMLDLGVLPSSKIEEKTIDGKKVFSVADGYLIACFDKEVTEDIVKAIALKQPYYAVFQNGGIASDSVALNFEQIFETYSPKTQRRIL